jgi:hypothetical protein
MHVVLEAPIPAYEPPAEAAPVPILLARARAGSGASALTTLFARLLAWLRGLRG